MKWIDITTEAELDNLYKNILYGWHDGCLREVHLWNSCYTVNNETHPGRGVTDAKVLFQGHWADGITAVELYFSKVQRFNLVGSQPSYLNDIYEATLKIIDGVIYWADGEGWDINDPQSKEITWISAKGLKWRPRNEWMGDTLRYGENEED